jgi:hypothetical protein
MHLEYREQDDEEEAYARLEEKEAPLKAETVSADALLR